MATTTVYGKTPAVNVAQQLKGHANVFYGLNYPTAYLPGKGYFHKTTGVELLKNNLKQLLRTEKGERVMLPGYGLGLRQFLFQPLDEDLVNTLREEVVVQINKWFPHLEITKLRVFEEAALNIYGGHGIRILLDVRATNLHNNIFTVETSII